IHNVCLLCTATPTTASYPPSLHDALLISIESALHRWLDSYRRNLDRIVVPSRFFIDKFVEWGWPREMFVHVPNFVDATAYQPVLDRKSTRLNSSHVKNSYAVFCLKKKKKP